MIYILYYMLRVFYKIIMLTLSILAYVIINLFGFILLFNIFPYKFRYLSFTGDNKHYHDFIYFCKSDRQQLINFDQNDF